MLYLEALPKFGFYLVLIACLQSVKISRYVRNAKSANSLPFAWYGCLLMWVPIFVLVLINVIKMGAYIHGVLISCGCLLSRFYDSKPRVSQWSNL